MCKESKDKVIRENGRKFIDVIEERSWYILNGRTKGDWEGEFTYIGARGCFVIDYIIVNEYVQERLIKFYIGDRVNSDHMPIIM